MLWDGAICDSEPDCLRPPVAAQEAEKAGVMALEKVCNTKSTQLLLQG